MNIGLGKITYKLNLPPSTVAQARPNGCILYDVYAFHKQDKEITNYAVICTQGTLQSIFAVSSFMVVTNNYDAVFHLVYKNTFFVKKLSILNYVVLLITKGT